MTMVRSNLTPSLAADVLESLPIGIWVADDSGTITWANQALGAQIGVPRDALVGRSCEDIPASKALTLYPVAEIYHVPGAALDTDRWLECIAGSVVMTAGRTARVGCFWDVTHYERARTRRGLVLGVQDPAKIDAASGLLTQKAVLAALVAEVSRSRRYDNPLAILVIRVWPTGEGQAGHSDDRVDSVVVRIAAFLKERLRWVDITGCWNRRNILAVLPETGLESAQGLMHKLRDEMSRHGLIDAMEQGPSVEISLGVTAWRKGDDAMSLVDRIAKHMAVNTEPG
ncbi:MAG: diguanylate cyclase, partial [Beggiatoa sp.]|nr:diguanylate cyclase [Beggiatoa sp.]